jgi:hypothetical protein
MVLLDRSEVPSISRSYLFLFKSFFFTLNFLKWRLSGRAPALDFSGANFSSVVVELWRSFFLGHHFRGGTVMLLQRSSEYGVDRYS